MYLLVGAKVPPFTLTPSSDKYWVVYHILGVKENIKVWL